MAPFTRTFSNRKTPPPRPPPNTSAATAAPTTHKPKPTQLNGQTAAAASTHICRGLTITNHITFPTYRQPRFGPTLPTLSGCHCCELRHLTAATAMAANSYCKRLGKSPIHSRAMSPTLYNRLPLDNRQRSARIHVANVQTS